MTPKTPKQWQDAVDIAEWGSHLESARAHGLITGGLLCNQTRCEQILNDGRARGIRPTSGCIERLTREYMIGQRLRDILAHKPRAKKGMPS